MLKLSLSLEPRWVDVGHGVRLLCKACTSTIMATARGSADVMAATEAGNVPLVTHLMTYRVAHAVIIAWEGVGDESGEIEPTPAYIDALFEQHPRISDRFAQVFLAPMLQVEEEKNGSGPSLNGTSAAGRKTTAVPATGPAKRAPAKSTRRVR